MLHCGKSICNSEIERYRMVGFKDNGMKLSYMMFCVCLELFFLTLHRLIHANVYTKHWAFSTDSKICVALCKFHLAIISTNRFSLHNLCIPKVPRFLRTCNWKHHKSHKEHVNFHEKVIFRFKNLQRCTRTTCRASCRNVLRSQLQSLGSLQIGITVSYEALPTVWTVI